MRWVMAWLGNGFGCSMKDERTCTMRHEVGVHLWWMMIWCVRSTQECVTTDISQLLICLCTFLRFQGLYSMTLSVVTWVIGKCVHDGCPRSFVPLSNPSISNSTHSDLFFHFYQLSRSSHALSNIYIFQCPFFGTRRRCGQVQPSAAVPSGRQNG